MESGKKAILAVSFGTSYGKSRELTIDKIEEDMQKAWPEWIVYRAWTSRMILSHIKKRDGIHINNVCEAMEEMAADSIRHVVVQPTHILNGIENDIMKEEVQRYADRFDCIRFGTPLLTSTDDNEKAIRALMEEYKDLTETEGLVWMGHGTNHYANSVYAALDYTFKDLGYKNVYMGTVEAYPEIENIIKMLDLTPIKKVYLAPFMVVAGDHANNDMAGDDADSWKNILTRAGYEVECHIRGLGQYEGIRKIYLEHLKKAMEG